MEIRLQKYISDCGLMSRRAAEKEIELGNFTINGKVASIGDKVEPNKCDVKYKGAPIVRSNHKVYVLLYKPAGYITTMSDEFGRKSVNELLSQLPPHVYPVGRLDKDSEGAVICTNDGTFANKIMHPKFKIKKVYLVNIAGLIPNAAINKLQTMHEIEGEPIIPVEVSLLSRNENFSVLRFVLLEGKNRQIRRMCEAAELSVMQLKRVAVGDVSLGELVPGKYRPLTSEEIKSFK